VFSEVFSIRRSNSSGQSHRWPTCRNAAEFLMADVVVMGIVIIGLVALFSDLLMRYLEHKLVPRKGKM